MKKSLVWVVPILMFVILAFYFSCRQKVDTLSLFGNSVTVKFNSDNKNKEEQTAQALQPGKNSQKEKRAKVPGKQETSRQDANTTNGPDTQQHYETHGSGSPIMPNNNGNLTINNQNYNSFNTKDNHQ